MVDAEFVADAFGDGVFIASEHICCEAASVELLNGFGRARFDLVGDGD